MGHRLPSRTQLLTEATAYNMDNLFRLPPPSSGVGARVLGDSSSSFRRELGGALQAELHLSGSSDDEEEGEVAEGEKH